MIFWEAPSDNKRLPPTHAARAPENTARIASCVGNFERYTNPARLMVEANWIIEEVETPGLADSDLADIRRLMDDAFGDRFSEEDWSHALGGTHFVVRGGGDTIVSHAAVVDRRIEVSGDPLSTGYVEAVATHPRFQRKGLATAVMSAVAEFIAGRYRMGALSTSLEFYERLGWIRWRGQTWCREGGELFRTADDDGGVWILPTRSSPRLDLESDIVVEWRGGDVW